MNLFDRFDRFRSGRSVDEFLVGYQPKPSPMPDARGVCYLAGELAKAAGRANHCWARDQCTDALRSVRYWLELAEAELARKPADVQPPPPEL